jgi:hypothetical protein
LKHYANLFASSKSKELSSLDEGIRYVPKNPRVRLQCLFTKKDLQAFGAEELLDGMNALRIMPEDEYRQIFVRAKNANYPPNPSLLLSYLLTAEDQPKPHGAPSKDTSKEWSRRNILSCMDDMSGLSRAVPFGLDAKITYAFLRSSIFLVGFGKHFLPEITGGPIGAAIGHLAASPDFGLGISAARGEFIGAGVGIFSTRAILFLMDQVKEIRQTEKDLKERQHQTAPWRFDPYFVSNHLKELGIPDLRPSFASIVVDAMGSLPLPITAQPPTADVLRPACFSVPPTVIPRPVVSFDERSKSHSGEPNPFKQKP